MKRKNIVFSILILMVAFMGLLLGSSKEAMAFTGEKKIRDIFPDPAMAQAVIDGLPGLGLTLDTKRDEKWFNNVSITFDGNLANPHEFVLRGNITNLEGIQYFKSVNSFRISSPVLTSIAPLTTLSSKSKVLNLTLDEAPNITDLASLSSFTGLQRLVISNNKNVSNISFVSGMTQLQQLSIENDAVDSLDPVANLVNLKNLYAKDNRITDISALKNLNKLSIVYVDNSQVNPNGNNVTSLEPLRGKNSITEIGFRYTSLTDVSPLASSKGLVRIFLDHNKITDVKALSNLKNVQRIVLDGNLISDIKPINGLTLFTDSNPNVDKENRILRGFKYQQVTAPDQTYSRLLPFNFNVENVVRSFTTNVLTPSTFGYQKDGSKFTADASYSNKILTYNLPGGVSGTTYNFSDTVLDEIRFSGTVTIPLTERNLTNLKVTNTINNCPDPSQTMSYTIVTYGDEGSMVNATTLKQNMETTYANKLIVDGQDPNKATFTLVSGESMEFPVLPNGSYKISQNVNPNLFNSQYKTQSGTTTTALTDYQQSIDITKSITDGNNQIDFVNNYLTAPLTITNKDISGQPLQKDFVFHLQLDWQGMTTGTTYAGQLMKGEQVLKNVTIVLNGQPQNFTINDGEKLVFPNIPHGMKLIVTQDNYPYYNTSYGINKEPDTQGNTVQPDQGIGEGGYTINFQNDANYIPPVTGIHDNAGSSQTMAIVTMFMAILFILGYIIQLRLKRRN